MVSIRGRLLFSVIWPNIKIHFGTSSRPLTREIDRLATKAVGESVSPVVGEVTLKHCSRACQLVLHAASAVSVLVMSSAISSEPADTWKRSTHSILVAITLVSNADRRISSRKKLQHLVIFCLLYVPTQCRVTHQLARWAPGLPSAKSGPANCYALLKQTQT